MWWRKIKSFALLVGLYFVQDGMIFKPHRKGKDPELYPTMREPDAYGLEGFTAQRVRTEDGVEIVLWHAAAKQGQPSCIFFHGNTGHLGDCGVPRGPDGQFLRHAPHRDYRIKTLRAIAARGWGVVAVSYRGYGLSGGSPSEKGLRYDAAAAVEFVQQQGAALEEVVLYGDSLGGAVALHLAADLEEQGKGAACVVAVATFASIEEKAMDLYPWLYRPYVGRFLRHHFDSVHEIAGLRHTPVLLVHGEADATTPIHHSEILAAAGEAGDAPMRFKRVPGGGHVDIPADFTLDQITTMLGA